MLEGNSDLFPILPSEEDAFRSQGYLLLRSALSMGEVESLLAEVKQLVAEAISNDALLREEYYHRNSFKLIRVLRSSRAFDRLVDHPGYFGKLVSLIGAHIQLMDTEIFVRGASGGVITGFHTDLGEGLQTILPTNGGPFLEIKAQIFLTDLSEENSSNFAVVPGSHCQVPTSSNELGMIEELNAQIKPDGTLPPGAIQILAKPGDVLLFPHSLWHAVAANRSGRTRYSISFRYGLLALRPLERFDPILADRNRHFSPRQRRLMGDLGDSTASPYRPPRQKEIIFGE